MNIPKNRLLPVICFAASCVVPSFAATPDAPKSSASAPVQAQDSTEKKNLTAEMLALFRKMNAVLAGVSDKASADAAAPKIRKIEAEVERIPAEYDDASCAFTLDDIKALEAPRKETLSLLKGLFEKDFFGSEELKEIFADCAPAFEEAAPESSEPPAPSEKMLEASSLLMNYYKNPDPEKIAGMLPTFFEMCASKNTSGGPLVAFLTEIVRANPDRIPEWKKITDALPRKQRKVADAVYRLAADKNYDLTKGCIGAPGEIDMLWGAFFATGDPKFPTAVTKIAAKVLPEGVIDLGVASAAWSLASVAVAQGHAPVLDAARAYLKSASREEREALASRLSEENQKALLGEVLKPGKN
ncbi:MAG: hypothetical protein ACI4QA_04800 [Candidatus Spyradosoma sp.]